MWELWEWEEGREEMEVVDRRQHTPQLKENDGPLQVPETGFASCWGNRFCSRWETVLPPKRSCSRTGSGGSALHHLTKWACFSFTHRLSLSCVAHQHYWCWQAGWLIGIKSCAVLSSPLCCEHHSCETPVTQAFLYCLL